jgi:hypothetical protein
MQQSCSTAINQICKPVWEIQLIGKQKKILRKNLQTTNNIQLFRRLDLDYIILCYFGFIST